MDDHKRFIGTKYEKGNNNKCRNHYKCGAYRLRTVVKSCFFFFSCGIFPAPHVSLRKAARIDFLLSEAIFE